MNITNTSIYRFDFLGEKEYPMQSIVSLMFLTFLSIAWCILYSNSSEDSILHFLEIQNGLVIFSRILVFRNNTYANIIGHIPLIIILGGSVSILTFTPNGSVNLRFM